jgi:hypothetical protein
MGYYSMIRGRSIVLAARCQFLPEFAAFASTPGTNPPRQGYWRFVRKGLKGCVAATAQRGGAGARERGAPESPVFCGLPRKMRPNEWKSEIVGF